MEKAYVGLGICILAIQSMYIIWLLLDRAEHKKATLKAIDNYEHSQRWFKEQVQEKENLEKLLSAGYEYTMDRGISWYYKKGDWSSTSQKKALERMELEDKIKTFQLDVSVDTMEDIKELSESKMEIWKDEC